jgi:hypothetical protein
LHNVHVVHTDDDFGEGITNVLTEGLVATSIPVGDSRVDVTVDLDSVEEDVLTNVEEEGEWVGESMGPGGDGRPEADNGGTVFNRVSEVFHGMSKSDESIGCSRGSFFLKVVDCFVQVLNGLLRILKADGEVVSVLSLKSSHENTINDLSNLSKREANKGGDWFVVNWLSNKDLFEHISNVLSELVVVLGIPVGLGVFNIMEELNSIKEDILGKVEGKSEWVLHQVNRFEELTPVIILDLLAVSKSNLKFLDHLSYFFYSSNDFTESTSLKVSDGRDGFLLNSLKI